MRSLWMKIGLGAGVVFAAGMLLVTIAESARGAATAAVRSSLAGAGRMHATAAARSDLPFLLDGARLGTIQYLDLRRANRGGRKRSETENSRDGNEKAGPQSCQEEESETALKLGSTSKRLLDDAVPFDEGSRGDGSGIFVRECSRR